MTPIVESYAETADENLAREYSYLDLSEESRTRDVVVSPCDEAEFRSRHLRERRLPPVLGELEFGRFKIFLCR